MSALDKTEIANSLMISLNLGIPELREYIKDPEDLTAERMQAVTEIMSQIEDSLSKARYFLMRRENEQ